MESIWKKLLSYIPKNIASILGIIQSVIKFGKEVCTLLINLICPIIPGDNDDKAVTIVRGFFNSIDAVVEKIKAFLLKTDA